MVSNDRVFKRLENIEKKVDDISKTSTRNEQHLKDINGNINDQKAKIQRNCDDIDEINTKVAYMLGGSAVIGAFIAIGVNIALTFV